MPDKIALREALVAQTLAKLPWYVRLLFAVAAVTAGIIVIARPTMSLDLLARLIGIVAILEGLLAPWVTTASVRWRVVVSAVWITVGVIVLSAQWLTVLALTLLVGTALIGMGIYRIVVAIRTRQTLDGKIASITIGVAAVIFGVTAFFWRDISLVVLSIVFGGWLIVGGVDAGWRALPKRQRRRARKRRTGWRRFARSIAAIVTVSAAVLALTVTIVQNRNETVIDTFYAAPREVPDEPGKLLQYEEFTRGVPAGAIGYRYLYTTEASDGSIVVASAVAISPDDDQPHASVTWAHSTTGIKQKCAPSMQQDPFRSGGMFAAKQLTAQGMALIMPDYPGLGTEGNHPYLIGVDTGRSVLDATRAAYNLDELRLSRTTVLWGHSQGGHAVLWASQIAADYAPDLDIRGVAAISPASDLTALVGTLDDVTGGMVFAAFVLAAYQEAYPEVDRNDYLRTGVEYTAQQLPEQCLDGPGSWRSAVAVGVRLIDPSIFRVDPRTGVLGERLRENIPLPKNDIPLLVTAGSADPLINSRVQDSYVRTLCMADVGVQYDTVEGADHISMLYGNSEYLPKLLAWTADRIAKVAPVSNCS